MKILRTASLGSNFTGSYKKTECIMFIYFMSQPNVFYSHNNDKASMNIHKNNIRRNKRILQEEKTGVLLFMNSVHVTMYNTSRSYLNGLIIITIFF